MTNWLRVFDILLPRARAWSLTIGKTLRSFFEGLAAGLTKPAREYIDDQYGALNPQTTQDLARWEAQFGLPAAGLTEQERRDRLQAVWRATGGQDPRYLQDTLQGAGFDVYVHQWWVPDSDPVEPRNPRYLLSPDGTGTTYICLAGEDVMHADDPDALADNHVANSGYPLVNKLFRTNSNITSVAGSPTMYAGNPEAFAGNYSGFIVERVVYSVPTDAATWPYFLYIGGETFPALAQVPDARRDEFEALLLKICPTQQWIGVLVEYV